MNPSRTPFTILALSLLAPALAFGQGRKQNLRPQMPPPSITDYQPRSTLVVPEHKVPRAKFPVVDIHGHPSALTSESVIRGVVSAVAGIYVPGIGRGNP